MSGWWDEGPDIKQARKNAGIGIEHDSAFTEGFIAGMEYRRTATTEAVRERERLRREYDDRMDLIGAASPPADVSAGDILRWVRDELLAEPAAALAATGGEE